MHYSKTSLQKKQEASAPWFKEFGWSY